MKRPKALGLLYIVLVALIWVAASFVIQAAQGAGVNVVVLTFIANALFSVYLPISWIKMRLERRPAGKGDQEQASLVPSGSAPSSGPGTQASKGRMIRMQVFRAALVVGPLWYVAQLTFNLSLAHTSVTSNTVLSSTSSLFTLLISVWLLSEAFTLKKVACMFLLIAGTVVYTLGDTQSNGDAAQRTLVGDLLVLASAVLYASYTVAIRKALTDNDHATMILFFGLSGAVILLGLGPLLLTLWLAGAGLGTLTWKSFGLVVAMGLIDNVCSDYLYAQAILLAGPTIASAGLSLQVPIACMSDGLFRRPAWLGKPVPAVLTLGGATLVLVGFFGVNLGSSDSGDSSGSDSDA